MFNSLEILPNPTAKPRRKEIDHKEEKTRKKNKKAKSTNASHQEFNRIIPVSVMMMMMRFGISGLHLFILLSLLSNKT